MAQQIYCDFCQEEAAVMMVTNIGTGDTLGLGSACIPAWAETMLGQLRGDGYTVTDEGVAALDAAPVDSTPTHAAPDADTDGHDADTDEPAPDGADTPTETVAPEAEPAHAQ